MYSIQIVVNRFRHDSLSRNSFFLMFSTFIMAGIGFFFWTICARLYTTEQIGLATTLISITAFITNFSMLGFNAALIRFLPGTKEKNAYINTAFAMVGAAAIIVTIIFIVGLKVFSPKLLFLQHYPIFLLSLVIFMVVASLNAITDSVFISYRRAEFILVVNTIMSTVKLVLPVFLVTLGAYGIFYSFLFSVNVAMVGSILFLTVIFRYRFRPMVNFSALRRMWRFSFGNYVSSLLGSIPMTVAPLLITNELGPTTTAYYFMPTMVIQMLLAVPRSYSSSLFSEGVNSKSNSLSVLFFRSLGNVYLILVPISVIIVLLGRYILLFFGKNYSDEGFPYLVLVLLSVLIAAPSYLLTQLLNIRHRVKFVMFISLVSLIVSIVTLWFFLPKGLYGIGISSIISATIMLVFNCSIVYILR